MCSKKHKASSSFARLSLVMVVYALHMFSFLGVIAAHSAQGSGLTALHTSIPANQPRNPHDPASVESRAIFKYDDAKQLPVIDHKPALIARVELRVYTSSISDVHIRVTEFQAPCATNKRYRLLQVFLI